MKPWMFVVAFVALCMTLWLSTPTPVDTGGYPVGGCPAGVDVHNEMGC